MTPPRALLAAGALLVLFASAGCSRAASPDATAPEPTDGDTPGMDTAVEPVRVDTDRDGLCDDTERALRTDPRDPDTDGDGLSDLFEIQLYTSPLSATEPPRDEVLAVRERPGATASLRYDFVYRGTGESLLGVGLDRINGPDGRAPSELGARVLAVGAEPRALVAEITGATITGIDGRVRLLWEVAVDWPAIAPLGCRRAYMMYASAFRDGQGVLFARRVVLDVEADPAAVGLDAGASAADAAGDAPTPTGPGWPDVSGGFCVPPPGNCQ